MQTLVADLLTYARVLDEEAPRNVKNASSARVLNTVLEDLRQAVVDSGAVISYDRLPDVHMDETQLKQLFQNLISNAIKYGRPGEPCRISIAAELQDEQWLFSVKDDGIGIEPEYFEQIFLAFKRLHGNEYPGSGVGLTICKEIVQEYGGRIWVESEPGHGSTFRFTLPAVKAAASSQIDVS
jgi:light-regulated signal transduction histidine kinase (bacteriophytochrome)